MKNDEMRLKKEMIFELKSEMKELEERIKEIKRYKECKRCKRVFRSEKGAAFCSEECRKKYNSKAHDRRLHRNGKIDYSINLQKLYKKDKGICKLCGRPTYFIDDVQSDDYPSIDHIMPISKGGKHEWSNVQLAHRGCNNKKSDKIPPPSVKNS